MKILIAEDDPVTLRLLEHTIEKWGYEPIGVADGAAAWALLQEPNAPRILLIDWQMPGMDGIELVRRVRSTPDLESAHVLMLTVRGQKKAVVEALEAGADDFLIKPFEPNELRARLGVGTRVLRLQQVLVDRVHELEEALSKVGKLQRLLPICGYCKKVRSDKDYWQQVEEYFASRGDITITHGICPDCYETVIGPQMRELRRELPPYPTNKLS